MLGKYTVFSLIRYRKATAPGYRSPSSGMPGGVGGYGYSLSSAGDGICGLDLNFSTHHLYPSYSDNRGGGFQLRCLSE